jgi:hypothetical protein
MIHQGTDPNLIFNPTLLFSESETLKEKIEEEKQNIEAREKQKLEDQKLKQEKFQHLRSSGTMSMRDVLEHYCGQRIGINATDPSRIDPATLVGVQGGCFVVQTSGLTVHIPYSQIIKIATSDSADISVGFFGFGGNYSLIIRVFDFGIYKGAIGVSIPLGGD